MSAPATDSASRRILRIAGTVQGVGFRPFVHRTATSLGLHGAVWNEPGCVAIDIEGPATAVAEFCDLLERRPPPRAHIESVHTESAAPRGGAGFAIRESGEASAGDARVSADLATCDACLRELRDPADRRFGYAFLNCTDCGPRYSIVRDVPYDRDRTAMDAFAMCAACAAEYADPASRRFHAQPNACAVCGPRLWIEPAQGAADAGCARAPSDPIEEAVRALRAGGILALKGLGGFHLCCDAASARAVAELRARKQRPAKPFAVMFPDMAAVARAARPTCEHARQLVGARAPIVLVPLRGDAPLAAGVAPGLAEVGAFLPYTPLHHRLLDAFGGPLVMTSGNRSEEPIAARNGEARERLAGLADRRLVHDRRIEARVEDSVVRWMAGAPRVLRRARGFAPDAIELPVEAPPLLAVGADLKNALCLAAGRSAILAPHTGDLAHPETRALFAETRAALERTFRIRPQVVAHDLHPGHHGSALARAMRLPRIAVQHHHAHVAACLAEHGRCGPVIGVAWDGTGLGTDGTIWGGEFLVADLVGFERVARLRPVPLPGGDAAVRAPWRMAVAHLVESGLATDRIRDVDASREAVETLARRGWNAPPTSSAGRLFDAVAALLGVRGRASYEGQAASELEALATSREGPGYPLPVAESEASALLELDARPLVRAIVEDLDAGVARSVVAGRFHAALADAIARACERIRDATSLDAVALTGGCFQNRWLLEGAIAALGAAGFEVLAHREVPAGDGGIALGQAAVAAARSGREA